VGQWIYADCSGRYEGRHALELAVAAEGKRNLFQLTCDDRPLDCPPLVLERRLVLTRMPAGWPHAVGAEASEWVSGPILTVAERPQWVQRRRLNEALTRAAASVFFELVHEELHALDKGELDTKLQRAG
jgi:hypothetical protein